MTNKVKGVTANAFGYARISKLGVERDETPAKEQEAHKKEGN